MSSTRFKKGCVPWNKGKEGTYKLWPNGRKTPSGKDAYHWKGGKLPRVCPICKTRYSIHQYQERIGEGKTCSRKCAAQKRKGETPWNKGKPYPQVAEEKNNKWKGDDVGYSALHGWVRRHLGTPEVCEHCEKTGLKKRQIHWANKSQTYKREVGDWIRLCASCHRNYDIANR